MPTPDEIRAELGIKKDKYSSEGINQLMTMFISAVDDKERQESIVSILEYYKRLYHGHQNNIGGVDESIKALEALFNKSEDQELKFRIKEIFKIMLSLSRDVVINTLSAESLLKLLDSVDCKEVDTVKAIISCLEDKHSDVINKLELRTILGYLSRYDKPDLQYFGAKILLERIKADEDSTRLEFTCLTADDLVKGLGFIIENEVYELRVIALELLAVLSTRTYNYKEQFEERETAIFDEIADEHKFDFPIRFLSLSQDVDIQLAALRILAKLAKQRDYAQRLVKSTVYRRLTELTNSRDSDVQLKAVSVLERCGASLASVSEPAAAVQRADSAADATEGLSDTISGDASLSQLIKLHRSNDKTITAQSIKAAAEILRARKADGWWGMYQTSEYDENEILQLMSVLAASQDEELETAIVDILMRCENTSKVRFDNDKKREAATKLIKKLEKLLDSGDDIEADHAMTLLDAFALAEYSTTIRISAPSVPNLDELFENIVVVNLSDKHVLKLLEQSVNTEVRVAAMAHLQKHCQGTLQKLPLKKLWEYMRNVDKPEIQKFGATLFLDRLRNDNDGTEIKFNGQDSGDLLLCLGLIVWQGDATKFNNDLRELGLQIITELFSKNFQYTQLGGQTKNILDEVSPDLKIEWAIWYLSSSDPREDHVLPLQVLAKFAEEERNANTIVRRSMIPRLIELLNSDSAEVQKEAARVLTLLACVAEDSHHQDWLTAIKPLVQMLGSSDESAQKCAASALVALANKRYCCQEMLVRETILKFRTLLSSEDEEVRNKVSQIFVCLARGTEDGRAQLEGMGGILICRNKAFRQVDLDKLMTGLQSDDETIQRKTTEFIAELAENYPVRCTEALRVFTGFIQLSSVKAAKDISHFANTDEACCNAVVASGAIGPLFAMLPTHPAVVLHAFAGLARHGNTKFFESLGYGDNFNSMLRAAEAITDASVKRDCVSVMANFMSDRAGRSFFADKSPDEISRITGIVLPMLEHAEPHDAASLLSRLVRPNTVDMILGDPKYLALLVRALNTEGDENDDSAKLKKRIAHALGYIANRDEASCKAVIDSGAMAPLFAMLETHPTEVLHAFAAFARHENKSFFEFVAAKQPFYAFQDLEVDKGDEQAQRDLVTVLARFMRSEESSDFVLRENVGLYDNVTRKVIPMLGHANHFDVVVLLSKLIASYNGKVAELVLNPPSMPINYLLKAIDPRQRYLSEEERTLIEEEVKAALRAFVPAMLSTESWGRCRYTDLDVVLASTLKDLVRLGVVSEHELATEYRAQLEVLMSSDGYPRAKQFAATCLCALDVVDSDHVKWLELLTETYVTSFSADTNEQSLLVDSFERLSKTLAGTAFATSESYCCRVIDSLVDILSVYGDDKNVQTLVVRNLEAMVTQGYERDNKKALEHIKSISENNSCLVDAIAANKSLASKVLQSCVPKLGFMGTIRSVAHRLSSAPPNASGEMETKSCRVSPAAAIPAKPTDEGAGVQDASDGAPSWLMVPDSTGDVSVAASYDAQKPQEGSAKPLPKPEAHYDDKKYFQSRSVC